MHTCEHCGYTTEFKSNYVRHMNRKTVCGVTLPPPVPFTNVPAVREEPSYVTVDDTRVRCVKCEKELFKTSWKKHSCKGVPSNTCKYCGKHFNSQPSHSRHQKNCKHKNTPLPAPTTDPTTLCVNGYVYLLQHTICNGSDTYKIGKSNQCDLKRLLSYGNNRLVFQLVGCNDPSNVEKRLIEAFNNHFVRVKSTLEYFTGDVHAMIRTFKETVYHGI